MRVHSWGLGEATKCSHQQALLQGDPEAQTAPYKLPWGIGAGRGRTALGDAGSREGDMREQGDCVGSVPV